MAVRFALALEVTTDELLGLRPRAVRSRKPSRKILRRLEQIEKLPQTQQVILFKTIDTFIKGVGK